MAVLAACANGNLTSASTWELIDSTSYNNTETTTTALTTSYTTSSTFTPGAIVIDGIGVKLSNRTGTTGTITVALDQAGSDVTGTVVTINCSDLPAATTANLDGGWIFFKFAGTVTLVGATAYGVKAKTSSSSQVSLFSTATTNWARYLRTTTTQAPAAGDDMIITKEWTAAATGTARTVTMDSTATTDYGSNTKSAVTAALAITQGGTLTYGTSASTNYVLRISGTVVVYNGGTLSVGTNGGEIPRTSTAVLELDCDVADGDFYLLGRNGGTVNMYGLSRTSGKNVIQCKLNSDLAAAGTTLNVDTDTGWLNGDVVCLAPTSRTYTQFEKLTLNADAGASSMTTTAGAANAHSGTSPAQGEVGLITRNVKFRSTSSTLMAYFSITGATVNLSWAEVRYCSTGTFGSIDFTSNLVNNITISYCSIYDTDYSHMRFNATPSGTINVNNTVFYNNGIGNSGYAPINLSNAVNTNVTLDTCTVIGTGSGGSISAAANLTLTNFVCAGMGLSFSFTSSGYTVNGLTVHSCASNAIIFTPSFFDGTTTSFSNFKVWRNSGFGLYLNGYNSNLIINTIDLFGNTTSNINLPVVTGGITFKNLTSSGDTSFATTNGIAFTALISNPSLYIYTGTFGVATGIRTAHSNDISNSNGCIQVILNNVSLSSAAPVSAPTSLTSASYIRVEKLGQTAGNHKSWFKYGIIQTDTTFYNTASPGQRLTPNNASFKLQSGSQKVAVNNGQTATPAVYIRKSSAGDGTAYNGNQPRLIVKENPSIGITSDTVLATYSSGTGSWNQITGTTAAVTDDGVLEFVVDCDGTTGWIVVDDWTISVT